MTQLTLPDGTWIPYSDLPSPARRDSRWQRPDYDALRQAISCTTPKQARKHRSVLDPQQVGQQQISTLISSRIAPLPIRRSKSLISKIYTNKFHCINLISDKRPTNAYMCHFNIPAHQFAHLSPLCKVWESDWKLGKYMCQAAAFININLDEQDSRAQFECTAVYRVKSGQIYMDLRSPTGSIHSQPISGRRGI